jgi:hypothetical protein
MVRATLRKYGYPPDKQENAIKNEKNCIVRTV